ncbi:MAG: DNA polymerase III subunit delta' [Planctomycetes bacterium]|nr:DNA polymerase III subunit delta' [Planctomycetota bacterium]
MAKPIPQFAEVIGHADAVAGLQESIRRNRIASAYLFAGPEGVGRNTLMQAFAAALLCETTASGKAELETPEACGKCKSCRLLAAGNHPDYQELQAEKATLSVEEMRTFCQEIALSPIASERRIGVIPNADSMTLQAANCFLKTLEEPPGDAVILLRSASTDRLLLTVVSRCLVIRLGPLPLAMVAGELVKRKGCLQEEAEKLAVIAEGSLGRAQLLAEGDAGADWLWLEEAIAGLRPEGALSFAEKLVEKASRNGGSAAQMRLEAQALLDLVALQQRRSLRTGTQPRAILKRLEAVWHTAELLGQNVTPELALKTFALDLAEQ